MCPFFLSALLCFDLVTFCLFRFNFFFSHSFNLFHLCILLCISIVSKQRWRDGEQNKNIYVYYRTELKIKREMQVGVFIRTDTFTSWIIIIMATMVTFFFHFILLLLCLPPRWIDVSKEQRILLSPAARWRWRWWWRWWKPKPNERKCTLQYSNWIFHSVLWRSASYLLVYLSGLGVCVCVEPTTSQQKKKVFISWQKHFQYHPTIECIKLDWSSDLINRSVVCFFSLLDFRHTHAHIYVLTEGGHYNSHCSFGWFLFWCLVFRCVCVCRSVHANPKSNMIFSLALHMAKTMMWFFRALS